MKANLPQREPLFLAEWLKEDIYQLIRQRGKGRKKYILHDGPPYANGDIHMGHVLNKVLKDIVVKYKTMRGYDSAYVPGWDCHGLPIEHQLFKELKIDKSQIARDEFRKKAHQYALKYADKQREQFQRLGVFGDWNNPYLTLNVDYEAEILRSFNKLVKSGFIQRGLKPVNWCFKCETALAEAEVEYQDHTSVSAYVKFKLERAKGYREDTYLLIWTTTPWTLIANVAVAAHPDLDYCYIKTEKGNLILAKDLLEDVLSKAGIQSYELISGIKGSDLEGLSYSHPFGLRKGRVVFADYVSRQEGTGLVHTAPGHGAEDYATGLKYRLDIIMPVDTRGVFDSSAGEFSGVNVFKANELILDKLQSLDLLFFRLNFPHSYPHCWRCKSPIIFRATKQWFLKLDHKGLRKRLLEAVRDKVQWIPESGKERISAMIELRPDWCLSRQRYWGVPIPALVCSACGEEFLLPEVIDKIIGFVKKEGADAWFSRKAEEFLPRGFKCPHCRASNVSKGDDILDVWFDSGISHQAVLKQRRELDFPCELYLEGSDQHRGWFQSALITAICVEGRPPFKDVLTHGFVVDGQGRKMSKSLGNVIAPGEIIKQYGVDILRLWVASSGYSEDIRISDEILLRLSEAYRKIRNTARFILSNLYDFDPDRDRLELKRLKKIDKWILYRLNVISGEVREAYENFNFHLAYKTIYDFCNEELSMSYLDMVKGRLYTYAADSCFRRAAQTVIYELLKAIVGLAAPILAFTVEEIWQCLPKERKDIGIKSAHLLDFPKVSISHELGGFEGEDSFKSFVMDRAGDIAKALEEKRSAGLIGSSFDAQIKLLTKDQKRYKYLDSLKDDLSEIFKVSRVSIEKTDKEDAVVVEKAQGGKCVRCWNYSLQTGSSEEHPLLCERCVEACTAPDIARR